MTLGLQKSDDAARLIYSLTARLFKIILLTVSLWIKLIDEVDRASLLFSQLVCVDN